MNLLDSTIHRNIYATIIICPSYYVQTNKFQQNLFSIYHNRKVFYDDNLLSPKSRYMR